MEYGTNPDAKPNPTKTTQGDPSETEGKTAHSTKWKVQYQSGRVI